MKFYVLVRIINYQWNLLAWRLTFRDIEVNVNEMREIAPTAVRLITLVLRQAPKIDTAESSSLVTRQITEYVEGRETKYTYRLYETNYIIIILLCYNHLQSSIFLKNSKKKKSN